MITVTRKIDITAEDIANGKPKECSRCPGALATMRAFPAAKYVDVMHDEVQLAFPNRANNSATYRWVTAATPEVFREFIHDFDQNKVVRPISFELTFNVENPDQCLPLSASSESISLPSTSDTESGAASSIK